MFYRGLRALKACESEFSVVIHEDSAPSGITPFHPSFVATREIPPCLALIEKHTESHRFSVITLIQTLTLIPIGPGFLITVTLTTCPEYRP